MDCSLEDAGYELVYLFDLSYSLEIASDELIDFS